MKKQKPQKIIFCTYSSLYSSIVLKALLAASDIKVVGIVNSTRQFKAGYSAFQGSRQYIRETGWFYSFYLFFVTDFFRIIHFLWGKQSIHTLAKEANIPILDTQDINDAEGYEFVASKSPDYVLSAHFNQLFKKDILTLPKNSALNIHPSLLPYNRGVDPIFYSMLRNNELMGVTLHIIDKDFDTGNIVSQEKIEHKRNASLIDNNSKAFALGGELAVEVISNSIRTTIVQLDNGNYDSWPTPEIVKTFRKKGLRLCKYNLRQLFTI